ncbi:polycystin-1-like protein 2 [Tachysurus vachellii]|uniref:polycystin-1-like protein 2 n=1 Tax=Tachysurus vachellii TaxID=175792 RepID=UPI00296AE374|nr:polycystin-1-like protein 2 [Tachysurus vachellii]
MQEKMDTHPLSTHLLLVILSISAVYSEEDTETQICLEHQKAFEGSCYEFVTLQRSFLEAQSWCERGGGHLAFIQNDETQQFLHRHLQLEQDWWLGLAPSSFNFSMGSAATEGSLSWLDGSDVSYSNWFREPEVGEACGYIMKQSGFQWASTENCSQELHFICEFESGHALACLEHNATLQCGSGQVIEIDDSFYGRKTPHYCRAGHSLADISLQEECSWVDVVDTVSGHCHGLQVCQAVADVASFGEPCPGLGSYLSVDYHCKDGLHLLINKQAAVFQNITLATKWLLHPFQGNLTCTLNAGDGHTIDPYMPEELQSIIVHRYQRAGVYTVTVECSTSEWHVTAQKTIRIQEPVGKFSKIVCHSSNQTTDSENCKGLNNHVLRIQVQLSAGTNITYKIQHGITELVRSSEVRGIVPHNITITQETLQLLGLGCHQLSLLASNGVTAPDVSVPLELCLVEPVDGLKASVAPEQDLCSDSALYVNVSLDHGAPVELLFLVTADNDSFSEIHRMLNGSLQMFRTGDHTGELSGNILMITANPESPVVGTSSIMLDVNGLNGNANHYTFAWNCSGTCPCNVSTQTKTHQINATCLPPPYSFSVYTVTAQKTTVQLEEQTASKCIFVSPGNDLNPVITCSNCNPVNVKANVNLQLQCEGCQQIVWYFEDKSHVPDVLSSCYSETGQKSLIKQKEGASSFIIESEILVNAQQNINVVVYGVRDGLSGSTEFTIPIFGVSSTLFPTLLPNSQATNRQPASQTQSQAVITTPNTPFSSPTTAINPLLDVAPSCNINPTVGDIFSPFNILCTVAPSFCKSGPCMYCFRTSTGDYLYCGHNQTVKSLFLPLGGGTNYTLVVAVIVENVEGEKINTTLSVQVNDVSTGHSVEDLQGFVSKQVDQMLQHGKLTGATLAQMFQSVSYRLNEDTPEGQKQDAKMKLREKMLIDLGTAVNSAPLKNPGEVQKTADAVVSLTTQSEELTSTAQLEASSILSNLSLSLVSLTLSEGDDQEVTKQAVIPIIQAASNILKVSARTDQQDVISENLLHAADNVQSALLVGASVDQEPIIVSTSEISVYVNRMSPVALQKQSFSIEYNSSASFVLPSLGPNVLPLEETVDLRMLSFAINPFPLREGELISGAVASLSITRENGSVIPVSDLSEEIEIILSRPEAEVNSTFLDLKNYSTLIINVTTPNISLVLKLDPSDEIPLHLLLGFEHYPNNTHYKTTIQLPQPGNSAEDRYAWVLDSRDITLEVGVYYLLVRPIGSAVLNSSNASVYITSIAAQCKYWDETETTWSDNGCRVGPHTTPLLTQCLCTHLTFFGSSFFVMPNLVDVSRTAELFATFVNNPVVVCFVGAIFLIYLIAVVWARRKDIQDTAKVKVTVLDDNDPLAEYRYLLTISTGHRRGASTSSQATVTLLGSEGESEPHHLTDPEKPVFERGGTDMFLLTTPFSLGELQSIRLWHDNSGKHPAWYVNKAMVQDLETGQKWHFLCSSWLAIDVGECTLDKVFPAATETDLKRFSNLFFMKTTKDFQDGHIWFSVITRPPNSNFTRVQRVSCCFSLLLCTMLTSIMFWGIPTDPSEQTMDLGKIEFTWQQVMIGIQSSIIMFPINLLIVSIFRNVRPRERATDQTPKQSKTASVKQGKTGRVSPTQPPSPQSDHREITPDAVTKDIKRIAQSLSKALRSPMPTIDPEKMDINDLLSLVEDIICQQNRVGEFYSDASKKELAISLGAVNLHERSPENIPKEKHRIFRQYLYKQLQNVEKELRLLGPSRFSKPESYIQAVLQVQGMKRLLEPYLSSSSNRDQISCSSSLGEHAGGDKKCCQKGLPWWFVFVGWILVAATSGVSAYFTMMYGLTYGTDRSISWLISMVVSFFESLFITQPIKVLGFAVFFALVLKTVDQEDYGDVSIEGALSSTDDPDSICIARRDSTCSFYQPPPPCDIEKMRNNMIKEQKVFALIREILIYVGFLWMLLLVAYGQRDPNAFYLTQHIQQSFRTGIADSMTYKDVFTWANTTLLNRVFGQQPGFITDGNSKLVGNARLRQVRVHKDSCRTSSFMSRSIHDCNAPYSWEVEDMGSYSPGWNRSTDVNVSKSLLMPWWYQTQSRLRAHPIWGGVAFYRGGGFVVDLGPNKQNARSLLQYLFESTWVDKFSRAIFVEFTVYNANVNLFCIVTLMFENTAVGAFQYRSDLQSVRLYQSTDGFHIFMMASEAIYFLFILYYMFQQGKLMKQHKWEYFRSKWNVLELAIIILSWSALCVFIKRTLLGKRDIEYYQNHKDEHASFHETATADGVLGYLIAFLVLLATVKLWHLLRLNPKLQMITATLHRAWNDISGFIIVMTIMLLAYSIACNLMYGWKLYSYHTLLHAAKTIVSLQLGIFNYEEVLHYNPVLGAFVIGSCIIFMTFVVLNLFISVILVAFSEEQIHHKPSEEEEIVDLMLMKICSLLGIRVKKNQFPEEPKAKPFAIT